ncbi:MAG TPA: dephospho-CoA kinase [Mycobacterium sp.]|nr:dephospho-CoA kinase [Mycobacterium sp.]
MLRIGLTGGIGAGKSAVSTAFAEFGAIVVDGDVLAREVVEPGTAGLAALVEAFGRKILLPDGALNRPALAAVAFADDAKRATLNGIVHPLVARRRAEIIAAVPDEAVVVEDIPLLVESQMAPLFPLVVIVHADPELRVQRLVEQRGMPEADARARIAAQAGEEQRRQVADVWLDNSGSRADLMERCRDVWQRRIVPFADNLHAHRIADTPRQAVPADPTWPVQASRVLARIRTACGHRAVRVDHVGLTAVPGAAGQDIADVIDVQVTVESLGVADDLAGDLLRAGYPRVETINTDEARPDARSSVAEYDHDDDPALWHKRIHASADPGRPTRVHVRVNGWPGQQFALLLVDWLTANPRVRAIDDYRAAWAWADRTGWRP